MFENCEQLCLSSFRVNHLVFKDTRFFDARIGKNLSSFCFVLKGLVTFETVTQKTVATAGDFLYMPKGVRYSSYWRGNPVIDYFGIDFQFKKNNNIRFDQQFDLQKIDKLCTDITGDTVKKMYLDYKGNETSQMRAIGEFYKLFSASLPLLTKTNPLEIPSTLQCALSYIEQHYIDNFSVSDLARFCHLSESRLYHLFKETMNCTPITYKNEIKIQYAIEYLKETNYSMEEISDALNFHSTVYFRKVFKKMTGLNPMEYRKLFAEKNS